MKVQRVKKNSNLGIIKKLEKNGVNLVMTQNVALTKLINVDTGVLSCNYNTAM